MSGPVIDVAFGKRSVSIFDEMPWLTLTYEGGGSERVFQYSPDEFPVTRGELVGLTRQEVFDLRDRKTACPKLSRH